MYYNYTQPEGNYIPYMDVGDPDYSKSKDAKAQQIIDTFHLASGNRHTDTVEIQPSIYPNFVLFVPFCDSPKLLFTLNPYSSIRVQQQSGNRVFTVFS